MTKATLACLGFWLVLLGSCSQVELVRNPFIERWCGDRPCEWLVDGTVERVGSWHPNDYAVSLVSDDASLTQTNATITGSTTCLGFSLVAKISRRTEVYLELDFLADGTVEFSQRLPESDWDKRTFRITAPEWYHGVRFILRKQGPGEAILGELSATSENGYCTTPPVELGDRPNGASCSTDDQCAQAPCQRGTCGGCAQDAECAEGEVCAASQIRGEARRACMAPRSREFGALCEQDDQCQSGLCVFEFCSECRQDSCGDDRMCKPIVHSNSFNDDDVPWLCDPGQGLREPGALCVVDSDCASGTCEGAAVSCPITCTSGTVCPALCPVEASVQGGQCQ